MQLSILHILKQIKTFQNSLKQGSTKLNVCSTQKILSGTYHYYINFVTLRPIKLPARSPAPISWQAFLMNTSVDLSYAKMNISVRACVRQSLCSKHLILKCYRVRLMVIIRRFNHFRSKTYNYINKLSDCKLFNSNVYMCRAKWYTNRNKKHVVIAWNLHKLLYSGSAVISH